VSAPLLLDSHALLWFVEGNTDRIGAGLRQRIEAAQGSVSIASLWEIAIKTGLGKLKAPDDLPERVVQLGFDLLPVTAEHAWAVRQLPHHHRDPFDRMLIAQAQVERLPIVSADYSFEPYDVSIVWG
jgi:PIN domain nuclease of toxin-antitoxin system